MDIIEIANQVATHLGATSVLCYGSYAMNIQDHKSDIDLLVLMPSMIPDNNARQACYDALKGASVLELDKDNAGGWDNSWSPVNDRLQIDGQVIEIGYDTTEWVKEVIDSLINKHKISFEAFKF